jgi:hypothetical protein
MSSSFRARSLLLGSLILLAIGMAACQGQTPPVPDAAPRTAAFWYLWYPQTTTGHYTPTSQPYTSDSTALLKTQIDQMQGAGIQVGIASWFGRGTQSEATRIPAALAAADGTNFRETIYYEPEGLGSPSAATIDSDLAYLGRYTSSPNWLHIDGKPVIFVYG